MTTSKKKILVVEDDPMINSMYKTKFKVAGFEVFTADNGVTGLELVKKEKPDIVMLDVMLPQLDGFSVLEQTTKDIPVIMLTNLGTDEDKAKGARMGALDYLVKASLTPGQISEKIKQILKIKL